MKKNITLLLIMLLSGVSTAWADWVVTGYQYKTNYYTTYGNTVYYNGLPQTVTFEITSVTPSGCTSSTGEVKPYPSTDPTGGTYYFSASEPLIRTDANTYNVKVKNWCTSVDHGGEYTLSWTISPYNISGGNITTNSPSATYTGSPINVDFTVSFTKGNSEVVTLTKGTDYTVTPATVTTIGTHEITITGIGNFTGSITKNFQVISAEEYWTVSSYTASTVYNGNVQHAHDVINITNSNCGNSNGLVSSNTYTSVVSGQQSATDVGSYTAEVKNTCPSHPGTYTFSWEILPYNVSGSNFSVTLENQNWTGNAINVSPTVQFNTTALMSGTDYTFYTTPSVVKDPGEYTLVVVGKGNFTGNKSLKFYVQKAIDHTDIKISERSKYQIVPNGSENVVPVIELTDTKTGTTLLQGTDFTISTETVNPDTKTTVTITGQSPRYTGTRTLEIWGLKEYYTKSEAPNNDVFDLHLIETTATGANAVLGNESNGVVISTVLTQLTIPASVGFDIDNNGSNDATIAITGIDNKAFTGCNILSWIDATELTNYTPSGLDRTTGAASPFAGVPKQSLVFLYGSTITGENYVYKLGAGTDYRCDVFKIYDDTNGNQTGFDGTDYSWAYENPYAFTANTVVNTRVLSAGQHYTTCLPYPLQLPSSIKAYTLEASSSTLLGFKEVTGPLTAFTPYVIIPSSSGSLLSTENVTIPATTGITNFDQVGATTATTVGHHQLVGSLRYMETGADGCYIMQSGNTWKQFTGTGSHPNACILPMRAYVISSGYPSPARPRLSAVFNNGDGSTTAIDDLRLNPDDSSDSDNSELFDLQGRRVTSPPSPGIYIRNGKKIIVK